MMRKRFFTAPAAAVVALALGLGGALVTTTAASAHTPTVTVDCQTLSVKATSYDTRPQATEQRVVTPAKPAIPAVPAVPAVVETIVITPAVPAVPETPKQSYVEFQWKWWGIEGHGTTTWSKDQPTERLNDVKQGRNYGDWRKNGNQREIVTQAYVPGTPAIPAVTEHRVVTPAQPAIPAQPAVPAVVETVVTQTASATPNTVVVTIDGETVESTSFGRSFSGSYAFDDKYVAHAYTVVITAWNDPTGSKGWTKTFTGTSTPCERPAVAAAIHLTYMTDCAPDDTNTWRFRNPHTEAILLTLSNGDTFLAQPGESLYETERRTETLTARWGGAGTGIIAGSTVKASGIDEVSDRCAGPAPETVIVSSDWVVTGSDCDTRTVTETRSTTTTGYTLVGNSWVAGQPVVTTEERERPMTGDELDVYCPIDEQPAEKVERGTWTFSSADCDTRTIVETRTVTRTAYILVDREWVLGDARVNEQKRERAMTDAELEQYCPIDEQPADLVEYGEWTVSDTDCDTREVTEVRTVSTTTYELIDREWVAGAPVESTETNERPMTLAELDQYCPVDIQPAAVEVLSDWVVSEADCDTREVTETRTVTTTPYVLVDREWVPGDSVVTTEEQTRPMTGDELDEYCPVEIEPAAVEVIGEWMLTDSDCDTTTVTESRTVSTTPYVLVDREWVAGETVETTEERVRAMTDAERIELCPEAPVTPVTPTDLPTLALTDPPTLALTGPSAAMGGLGIAGLVALMAGLGLVLLRRPQAVSEEN